jgi:hypothetical protein
VWHVLVSRPHPVRESERISPDARGYHSYEVPLNDGQEISAPDGIRAQGHKQERTQGTLQVESKTAFSHATSLLRISMYCPGTGKRHLKREKHSEDIRMLRLKKGDYFPEKGSGLK